MFFLCIHYRPRLGRRDPIRRRSCDQTRKGSRLTAEDPASNSEEYTTIQKIPQIEQVDDLIVFFFLRGENGVNPDIDFQTSLASQRAALRSN